MSSQRGNSSRTRQQKHNNTKVYKNDLHNKSKKLATINKLELPCLCQRCKEVIEWKIKYGKYKPLTIPRKCNHCHEKAVKNAYYTLCIPCGTSLDVCCKCGEKKEIVVQPGLSAAEQAAEDSKRQQEIKYLTERQRRTYFRHQEKGEVISKLKTCDLRDFDESSRESCDENSDDDSVEDSQSNCDQISKAAQFDPKLS